MEDREQPKLEAVELVCVRDERTLLDGLQFGLGPGEIAQVEGPNGSGKTTLLRVICGLTSPDSGDVRWCGMSIQESRFEYFGAVAYIGHAHGVKAELTPIENLQMARALGKARPGVDMIEALDRVGLWGYEHVPSSTLSAGQRRRVALARLLVADAPLWVLDEPFTALDRAGRRDIEAMLMDHAAAGGMAILTTHHVVELGDCTVTRIQLDG